MGSDNIRGPLYPQKLLADHRPAKRKCLGPKCGRVFNSAGPGNRLCGSCREKVSKLSRRNVRPDLWLGGR